MLICLENLELPLRNSLQYATVTSQNLLTLSLLANAVVFLPALCFNKNSMTSFASASRPYLLSSLTIRKRRNQERRLLSNVFVNSYVARTSDSNSL